MKRFVPSSWNDHQKVEFWRRNHFPRAPPAACGARARTGPAHRRNAEIRSRKQPPTWRASTTFYADDGLLNQRVCNDVGAQGSLPSPLHRLQAVREPHPARGERRAALLPGRPALGPEHRPALLLAQLTIIGKNKAVFKPTVKAILDKYYAKYRGNSAVSSAEDAILDGWGSLPF